MSASTIAGSTTARFAVVVPVKPPAVGKSRLDDVDDEERSALARAFALDTVSAALAAASVGAVLVITDDAGFATALDALGCSTIPDAVALDLNETLRQGATEAHRRWPRLHLVAMCADLPALRPGDLDLALSEVAVELDRGGSAFVADTERVGTTLYAAPIEGFDPHFGLASARVHHARGAHPVTAEVASLRRDVDAPVDLAAAVLLGVGPHTSALIRTGS